MSLYLKYRPQDFDNLMGQSFVKETLQKAISDNKTVGAYLLCGPRWTWKTTTARLLAKTINCLNPQDWNPCLVCDICSSFSNESLIDIIEIDAASHTWVDNMRSIIEKAQFKPTSTKYKIYIIDEVHMLSTGAFNALLKILEEPPEHVKFILATTETHKVPETIISRCQRYDFKRISNYDISERLKYIAKKEWISFDEQSIEYITNNSNGGLRNAISLFEQLIFENQLCYENIVKKLEITSTNIIEDFLQDLIRINVEVIAKFDTLIQEWKNIKLFFKDLLYFTKNQALQKIQWWEPISDYIKILEILDTAYWKTKQSIDENTTFTIALLQILDRNNITSCDIQARTKSWESTYTLSNQNTIISQKSQERHALEIPSQQWEKISTDDIYDIFNTSDISKLPIDGSHSKKEDITSWFDAESFIKQLKEIWAKWGLTMALRWSHLVLLGNTLKIETKTKIAQWQIENIDNKNLMISILNQMWISNPIITF